MLEHHSASELLFRYLSENFEPNSSKQSMRTDLWEDQLFET